MDFGSCAVVSGTRCRRSLEAKSAYRGVRFLTVNTRWDMELTNHAAERDVRGLEPPTERFTKPRCDVRRAWNFARFAPGPDGETPARGKYCGKVRASLPCRELRSFRSPRPGPAVPRPRSRFQSFPETSPGFFF